MSKIHVNEIALEAATKAIYEDKGDRKGVMYIGWDQEPEDVKAQWRVDVRFSVEKYLAALPGTVAQQRPMRADITQIIDRGWKAGKSSNDVAEEILREFDAPAQSSWRDIDNAPRDGRWILTLSWPYSNIPTALHWDGNRWWDHSTEVPAGNTICEWQPSHWMPLLDGPSVSSTESKPGFFANLTPEQQKSALEYDGPENHGDAALIPTLRCTCAAEVNTDIPHARFCALSSTNGDGAAK